jgi:hypothetical protein
VSVLTQHNDNSRAGWNNSETVLTTANVNVQKFGKVFTLTVDDQVYAQPLVAGKVNIGGGSHNVVLIATVNNTLYAYDGENGTLYWQKNFTAPSMRPPRASDMTGACNGTYQDFSGNIGIVGTPVIDAATGTVYFVARSTTGSTFVQFLHAVNIVDGNEITGSPTQITATSTGNGDGNVNGVITFDAQRANQRQGLTLLNGTVYVTFSSHCDWGPYHGWILGYDASTVQQRVVYNDTPNGYAGGIWESGTGMAADAAGNLYLVTGNGTVGDAGDETNPTNRFDSQCGELFHPLQLSVPQRLRPGLRRHGCAADSKLGALPDRWQGRESVSAEQGRYGRFPAIIQPGAANRSAGQRCQHALSGCLLQRKLEGIRLCVVGERSVARYSVGPRH